MLIISSNFLNFDRFRIDVCRCMFHVVLSENLSCFKNSILNFCRFLSLMWSHQPHIQINSFRFSSLPSICLTNVTPASDIQNLKQSVFKISSQSCKLTVQSFPSPHSRLSSELASRLPKKRRTSPLEDLELLRELLPVAWH